MEEHDILLKAKEKYTARGDTTQLNKILSRLKNFETEEPKEVKVIIEKPKADKPKTKPKRKKK